MPRPARLPLLLAVAGAFAGGLLVAPLVRAVRGPDGGPVGGGVVARDGMRVASGGGPQRDVSGGFAPIAERVTPAVVSVETASHPRRQAPAAGRGRVPPGYEDYFRQFQQPDDEPIQSDGSGFLVTRDGYILTNDHVVADADSIRVTLTDHRTFRARLVGADPTTDVAVIKIDGHDLPDVVLGEDSTARVGDWVVAVGNPLGLDFTVTAGIVSAKGRGQTDLRGLLPGNYSISDFIQTDAAINPGNSGGPLLNTRGEVIGINSAIASRTGYFSGYGFAIPISLARSVMEDLIAHGRVRAPVLGVSIREVGIADAKVAGLDRIAGVLVFGMNGPEGGPAERAGLEAGDVIVRADGRPVDRVSTLQRIVRAHAPGETLAVEVMRYGQRRAFHVRLGERSDAPAAAVSAPPRATPPRVPAGPSSAPAEPAAAGRIAPLGFTVERVDDGFAQSAGLAARDRGLRVRDVARNGATATLLEPGLDVITDVLAPGPRRPVRSVADLQQAVARAAAGGAISLRVYSTATPAGARVVNIRVPD